MSTLATAQPRSSPWTSCHLIPKMQDVMLKHCHRSELEPADETIDPVKKGRRARGAVSQRRQEKADLVDQPCCQERAVDSAAAFQKQPLDRELLHEGAERIREIDIVGAGEDVRDAVPPEFGQVAVGHVGRQNNDERVPVHVALIEMQLAVTIEGNGVWASVCLRCLPSLADKLLFGGNRPRLAGRELGHRGPTDDPSITAKIRMDSLVEVTGTVRFWPVR